MLIPFVLFALLYAPQSVSQTVDPTLAPVAAHLRYTTLAHGVQIYQCAAQSGGFQWVFQAPEADLVDAATLLQVAKHGAGPSWTWKDGSSITGKVLQKRASSDAASIPWLLLETVPAGDVKGVLSTVTYVRRSETKAGVAPNAGCDAQHQSEVTRVPYAATYTFYSENR